MAMKSNSTMKQEGIYRTMEQLKHQVLRIDTMTILLALLWFYCFRHPSNDLLTLIIPSSAASCPRILLEICNLLAFGFLERWVILALVHYLEEEVVGGGEGRGGSTTKKSALPLSKPVRDHDFQQAQSKPWLHNKNALFLTISVLMPIDFFLTTTTAPTSRSNNNFWWSLDDVVSPSMNDVVFSKGKLCKDLLMGLFIIDMILGTAHMLSHKGPFKKYLSKYHMKHHTRHHNYSSVKYVGNPLDFEVVLTQLCYAFLPRILGYDVWTGMLLIDIFSLQLLLEHSGYTSLFAVTQHHEMHHNHGDVAFYHFPLTEMLFGRMPSLKQFERMHAAGAGGAGAGFRFPSWKTALLPSYIISVFKSKDLLHKGDLKATISHYDPLRPRRRARSITSSLSETF
jgi:hypothetical protein